MKVRALLLTTVAAASLSTASLGVVNSASAADAASATNESNSKKLMRVNDHALSHSVRKSMTRVRGLDSSHINVLTRGSTVTLAGTVPDRSQIDSAAAAAESVTGVSKVDNRLTVGYPGH